MVTVFLHWRICKLLALKWDTCFEANPFNIESTKFRPSASFLLGIKNSTSSNVVWNGWTWLAPIMLVQRCLAKETEKNARLGLEYIFEWVYHSSRNSEDMQESLWKNVLKPKKGTACAFSSWPGWNVEATSMRALRKLYLVGSTYICPVIKCETHTHI